MPDRVLIFDFHAPTLNRGVDNMDKEAEDELGRLLTQLSLKKTVEKKTRKM